MASTWLKIRMFFAQMGQRPDFSDSFWFSLFAILIVYWAINIQLLESTAGLLQGGTHADLDNILLSLAIFGIFATVYAYRRNTELRREIQRREQAEMTASWHAQHDYLTHLHNRSNAEKLIQTFDQQLLSPCRHVSFGINLNGFKRVNEMLGHRAGDDLLIVVAERLERLFPGKIVARTGGDEFLVFAEVTDEFDAEQSAQTILQSIRQPIFAGSAQAQISASIGYALYPDQVTRLADIIRFSDIAMNDARRAGKNVVRKYREGMDESLARSMVVELALREAIRNQVIVPFFQPLVDLDSGEIHGFEALARWRMEDGTFAEPSVFIQLAEDSGLIVDLSERLLRLACVEATNWPDHLTLAFNISPTQMTDRLLGLRIIKILDETGLQPHRLEIEITESTLVKEFDTASAVIDTLHEAGIRVALDDFGTGYSSLSQLSRFSFDKIKIDRSFTKTFRGDAKQMKIVKTIVGLGKGLGVKTTAEGIESQAEALELAMLGCDYGQGYLFGQAIPASDVGDLLARGIRPFHDNRPGMRALTL